ncbi:MAG: hypothetical protein M3R27_11600 [Bacteroidota bacterium]|nr:hypothetical protein [Bacteroidota bacterium]
MEDLTIEVVRDYLQKNKLPLFASQKEVSFPIIYRIHKRLKEGKRFNSILVDKDLIVNGHHRFVCLSILDIQVERSAWHRNSSSESICWSKIMVDEDDWDNDKQREIYRQRYDSEQVAS